MTDMYNPDLEAHYLAQPSQIRVLEKYGWLPYADWLAQQQVAPAPTDADPTV